MTFSVTEEEIKEREEKWIELAMRLAEATKRERDAAAEQREASAERRAVLDELLKFAQQQVPEPLPITKKRTAGDGQTIGGRARNLVKGILDEVEPSRGMRSSHIIAAVQHLDPRVEESAIYSAINKLFREGEIGALGEKMARTYHDKTMEPPPPMPIAAHAATQDQDEAARQVVMAFFKDVAPPGLETEQIISQLKRIAPAIPSAAILSALKDLYMEDYLDGVRQPGGPGVKSYFRTPESEEEQEEEEEEEEENA